MSPPPLFRLVCVAMTRFVCVSFLICVPAARAATVFFNFNTDPTAGSLLNLYGNANWQSTGGAGSATNATDGFIEVTPSAGGERGAVVFADFDNGAIIKAFTF